MPEWLNYCFSISWLPRSYNKSHIPDEVDYIKIKYLIFILLFWMEDAEQQQNQ